MIHARIFVLFVLLGCHNIQVPVNRSNSSVIKMQYAIKISEIEQHLKSPGTYEELFFDSNFLGLYENSITYVDSAIKYVAQVQYSDHKKAICILSLQRADIQNYLPFLDSCITCYQNEIISEDLLYMAIVPNFGKKRPVVKNYENPYERQLLEKMLNQSGLSNQFKSTITSILSGKLYKQLRDYNLQTGEELNM